MTNKDKSPIDSTRKERFREHANSHARDRDRRVRSRAFYEDDRKHLREIIPTGSTVLDLGCGTGELLEALQPETGVGIDMSSEMIRIAREQRPHLTFVEGDLESERVLDQVNAKFDYVVLSDTLAYLQDCETTLSKLHRFCTRETRLVISHHSPLWQPILRVAEWLRLKELQPDLNWFSAQDIASLLELADFQVVSVAWKQLVPARLLGIGTFINRHIARLPLIRRLCLRQTLVSRSVVHREMDGEVSLSVVIPCRNESGNVEPAVLRTPQIAKDQEIVFVEGHSGDGTWEEIQRVREQFPDRRIRAIRQRGKGKADAVWTAFDQAEGDVLMILDGDLTVAPETLPRFYRAITMGQGEFVMGTRMVYPLERDAMRFLNYWANKTFASIFSWLLQQRITDTLCGTKVITRGSYQRMKREHDLGLEDPFGDFDLIFGAAEQNLKIVEIPVRYAARTYGETQISRFRHGLMLLKMVFVGYRRMR